MGYAVIIKRTLLILFAGIALTACATQKKAQKQVSGGEEVSGGQLGLFAIQTICV